MFFDDFTFTCAVYSATGLTELQGGALVSAGALVMAISAIYISKQTQKISIYQLLSIGFIGMAITWGLFAAVLSYGLSYAISFAALFSLLILTRASTGFFMAMPQICAAKLCHDGFSQ